jgi:hypothetical protein
VRPSLREELKDQVFFNLSDPYQCRARVVYAHSDPASAGVASRVGDVVAVHADAPIAHVVKERAGDGASAGGKASVVRGGGAAAGAAAGAGGAPFNFATTPLVEYWRQAGFPYSDADAMSVLQVVVRLRNSTQLLTYPADKVFRMGAKPVVGPEGTAPAASVPGAAHPPAPAGRPKDFPWSDAPVLSLRDVITASPGFVLLGADYSQVCLSVCALGLRAKGVACAFASRR